MLMEQWVELGTAKRLQRKYQKKNGIQTYCEEFTRQYDENCRMLRDTGHLVADDFFENITETTYEYDENGRVLRKQAQTDYVDKRKQQLRRL